MLIKLKAISIRQPWAWLIVNGIKDVENRGFQTEPQGWIAIHASKTFEQESYDLLLGASSPLNKGLTMPTPDQFTYGAIVGLANHTANIVPDATDQSPWHAYGCHGWFLEEAYTIEPIPWRGALGLFQVGIPENVLKHQVQHV